MCRTWTEHMTTTEESSDVLVSNKHLTPWMSSRVPYMIAKKTIEPVPDETIDLRVPHDIHLELLDDTNSTDFAEFLIIISTFRQKNISEYMRSYIFSHMRLIVRICNSTVVQFCKQMSSTPTEILSVLEYADDGNYSWIHASMCDYLFTYIRQNRMAPGVQHLHSGLFKHICLHGLR